MPHNYTYSPSITDLLIATLGSHRSSYAFHQILREREFRRYKEGSVRVALSRLRKKGLVKNSESMWSLNQKGKVRQNEIILFSYLASPFSEHTQTNTIISFDIPQVDKRKRDWLRNQIKIFDYKMLQQSLWLGPGPLPIKFLKRLEKLEIRKNIKIFSVKRKNV